MGTFSVPYNMYMPCVNIRRQQHWILNNKSFLKNEQVFSPKYSDAMIKNSGSKKIVKKESEGNVRLIKYLEALILILIR